MSIQLLFAPQMDEVDQETCLVPRVGSLLSNLPPGETTALTHAIAQLEDVLLLRLTQQIQQYITMRTLLESAMYEGQMQGDEPYYSVARDRQLRLAIRLLGLIRSATFIPRADVSMALDTQLDTHTVSVPTSPDRRTSFAAVEDSGAAGQTKAGAAARLPAEEFVNEAVTVTTMDPVRELLEWKDLDHVGDWGVETGVEVEVWRLKCGE